MKPAFLVAYNFIRFFLLRLRCAGFRADKIQLIGHNTRIVVRPTSKVNLGTRIVSDGRLTMIVEHKGELTIGDRVYFNENAIISCINRVSIGSNCLFGPRVCIYDSNHNFDAFTGVKHTASTAPVTIGHGCWIGANVVILKGAFIGDNCVIGAGCVVSGKIPSGSIVTMDRKLKVRPIND